MFQFDDVALWYFFRDCLISSRKADFAKDFQNLTLPWSLVSKTHVISQKRERITTHRMDRKTNFLLSRTLRRQINIHPTSKLFLRKGRHIRNYINPPSTNDRSLVARMKGLSKVIKEISRWVQNLDPPKAQFSLRQDGRAGKHIIMGLDYPASRPKRIRPTHPLFSPLASILTESQWSPQSLRYKARKPSPLVHSKHNTSTDEERGSNSWVSSRTSVEGPFVVPLFLNWVAGAEGIFPRPGLE